VEDRADLTEMDTEAIRALGDLALSSIDSKLAITVMEESAIAGQLALLERTNTYAEVCTPRWIRFRDMHGQTQTAGELPPEDPGAHGFYAIRV
jgi:hypothetical protein